jgi:uncharacterized membrane protein HdeD (DUF308 family)
MSPETDGGGDTRPSSASEVDSDVKRTAVPGTAALLFKRAWWAIGLRGALAILLGIAMIAYPGMTLAVFAAMLGFYLFLDGMFTLVATFQAAEEERSWAPYLLEGLISIGLGILALSRPAEALLLVVLMLAARTMIVGAVEIGTGVAIRRQTGRSPWLLWLGGLASVVLAIVLFSRPGLGALALLWIIGVYAIVFGLTLEGEAFRMKERGHQLSARAEG